MDDKLQKEENIKEVDNPVKSTSSKPTECIVCATTSPEISFIYTDRTKLGNSLVAFIQKMIKPLLKLEDHPKCITICKSCLDSVNKLEEVQMKFKIHGDESTDSDSDSDYSECTKEAISKIEPPKRKISKIKRGNYSIFNIQDGEELRTKDEVLSQHFDREEEEKDIGNWTPICNICNRLHLRFSFGRNLTKEKQTDAPLDCLICKRIFVPRPCKKRKPTTEKKPFGCMLCRSRSREEKYLEQHLKLHTRQLPYQCHACELNFYKRPKLMAHLKTCKPCICGIKCYQVMVATTD